MTTPLTKEQMALLATSGVTASQLLADGVTLSQLLADGVTVSQLLAAGVTVSQLLARGVTLSQLLGARVTLSRLLAAGFTVSQLLADGVTASQLLDDGFTLSQLLAHGVTASQLSDRGFTLSRLLDDETPLLHKPYTALLAAIHANERTFDQSKFGPKISPSAEHICGTAMCTAGHLVSMAGAQGQALKDKLGFRQAAALIHAKAHPDYPCQNFGRIPDEWALAYIEMMADVEAKADAA